MNEGNYRIALISRLQALVDEPIDENLSYIRQADVAMTEAADALVALTHQLEAERERAVKAEERCEAYKGQVEAGAKEIEALKADLREKALWYLSLEGQATEALGRAVKAEEERDRLREELRREKERSVGTWATQRENDQLTILYHEAKAALAAALKAREPSHD